MVADGRRVFGTRAGNGVETVAVALAAAQRPAGRGWALLYLDPDIVVYHAFPEVFAAAERSGIALTPHVLHPLPRDGRQPDEQMLMLAGLCSTWGSSVWVAAPAASSPGGTNVSCSTPAALAQTVERVA
ncbi:MAG: hypothetical protein QOD72_1180, partial [Acidimicrobiaceae bacterium]|nr:hypothetical protein [Acidimicrobiaceae bacterium]